MKKFAAIAAILYATTAHSAVWEATNQWDQTWEDKYAEWVKLEYNETIFTEGKYSGISTDCADAVYGARAIFAFENSLPFAIRDTTGGPAMISNKMSRYDNLEAGLPRLKKFLWYVFDIAGTKSLPQDTYPVKIDRDNVRSGGAWIRPRRTVTRIFTGAEETAEPGHAALIKDVADTGVVYLIESTVPAAVRNLHTTSGLVFLPESTYGGLRRFYTPDNYKTPKDQLVGYSLEQFEMGKDGRKRKLKAWRNEVYERLALREETKEETLARYAKNFCTMMNTRIEVVQKAVKKKTLLGRCMDEKEFDNYSTPSRDSKALDALKEFIEVEFDSQKVSKRRLEKLSAYLDSCGELKIDENTSMTMLEAAIKMADKDMSSDPNQSLLARWGLEKEKNLGCKKYY